MMPNASEEGFDLTQNFTELIAAGETQPSLNFRNSSRSGDTKAVVNEERQPESRESLGRRCACLQTFSLWAHLRVGDGPQCKLLRDNGKKAL